MRFRSEEGTRDVVPGKAVQRTAGQGDGPREHSGAAGAARGGDARLVTVPCIGPPSYGSPMERCPIVLVCCASRKVFFSGIAWCRCREILRNSPTAMRILKAALNAAEDGHAGIQELGGNATMLFYQSEEGSEVGLTW
jgi:hypothetical protein